VAAQSPLSLTLTRCLAVCTEQEMDELSLGTRRYPHPPALRRLDATTRYDEWIGERTYRLDVRRAVPDGTGRRTWYLTVQFETAVADAATLQKIVNDIYNQTS